MEKSPLNRPNPDSPPHARPEVEGPNLRPTGSRFDTFTGSYADGAPPTPTITESARRARAAIQARSQVEAFESESEETPAEIRARVAREARAEIGFSTVENQTIEAVENADNPHRLSPRALEILGHLTTESRRREQQRVGQIERRRVNHIIPDGSLLVYPRRKKAPRKQA